MQNIQEHKICQVKINVLSTPLINKLFNTFKIASLLKKIGIFKSKGVPVIELLFYLFLLLFKDKQSTNHGLRCLRLEKYKSTINDLLNNHYFDWRKVMLYLAKHFSKRFKPEKGQSAVFIVDDTSKKKYGKKVEYLSWFYDHSLQCYYKGYQVVIGVWSNLKSYIPVDLVLKTGKHRCKHSERGEYPSDSVVHQRYRESRLTKVDICLAMIKRAIQHNITFAYILWDSWYNNTEAYKYVFEVLVSRGIHLVSMVKLSKEKYRYLGDRYNAKEIYRRAGKWNLMVPNEVLYKSAIIEVEDKTSEVPTVIGKVKICFYRFPGQKRKYKALISTNTELTEEEILKLYAQRWSIEVLIKDLKQYFGFDQAKSSKYAPQLADITIKCAFYIMLCSLKELQPKKSMFQLLFEFAQEFEDFCFALFFTYMFRKMCKEFIEYASRQGIFEVNKLIEKYDKLIEDFLNSETFENKIEEKVIVKKKKKSVRFD
jgi:hypothetical protein